MSKASIESLSPISCAAVVIGVALFLTMVRLLDPSPTMAREASKVVCTSPHHTWCKRVHVRGHFRTIQPRRDHGNPTTKGGGSP